MANPSTNYVYECSVLGLAEGQTVANVLHYIVTDEGSAGPNALPLSTVATAFRSLWVANVLPRMLNNYEAHQYWVREYTGNIQVAVGPPPVYKVTLGQVAMINPPLPDVGLRPSGAMMPTYVAVSARKNTGLGGREYRGAMRMGPVAEEDVQENELLTTVRDLWVAGLNGLLTLQYTNGTQTGAMKLAVFRATEATRKSYATNIAQLANIVVDISVNKLIGSQISRKELAQLGR